MNLPVELEKMLLKKLEFLKKTRLFCAIIPIPSRTWVQKENTCNLISDTLGVPAHFDLLAWREMPAQRQGELFNNDQRRENVHQKMCITRPAPNMISDQTILLLDDYTGSGATLKEAVRALRKQGKIEADIVPVTIARIRWRLGAKGMV